MQRQRRESAFRGAPRGGREGGFTLVELLIVILIIGILASLMLVGVVEAMRSSRQGLARAYLADVEAAAHEFQVAQGFYPPGNGVGSKDLAAALQKAGAHGRPYRTFRQEERDADGHVVNPHVPARLHYRNNGRAPGPPEAKNPGRIDLWCADIYGSPTGCRNW